MKDLWGQAICNNMWLEVLLNNQGKIDLWLMFCIFSCVIGVRMHLTDLQLEGASMTKGPSYCALKSRAALALETCFPRAAPSGCLRGAGRLKQAGALEVKELLSSWGLTGSSAACWSCSDRTAVQDDGSLLSLLPSGLICLTVRIPPCFLL